MLPSCSFLSYCFKLNHRLHYTERIISSPEVRNKIYEHKNKHEKYNFYFVRLETFYNFILFFQDENYRSCVDNKNFNKTKNIIMVSHISHVYHR